LKLLPFDATSIVGVVVFLGPAAVPGSLAKRSIQGENKR
jgi:hypothetical protein